MTDRDQRGDSSTPERPSPDREAAGGSPAPRSIQSSPGPWKVVEARGPEGEFCFCEVEDANGHVVVATWCREGKTRAEHEADARLIVAANSIMAEQSAAVARMYAAIEAMRKAKLELDEFEGVIDRQTYDEHMRAEYDMPDDAELHIVLTAKDERRLSNALSAMTRALMEVAPTLTKAEGRP